MAKPLREIEEINSRETKPNGAIVANQMESFLELPNELIETRKLRATKKKYSEHG